MTMYELEAGIILLLVALGAALITKRTRRPYTIALVIWGLILGILQLFEPVQLSKELVLTVVLPPLLFEGALHIKAAIMRRRAAMTFGLALAGTLLTIGVVGFAVHWFLGYDLLIGLLLGAILAPTDPVSVLATFRAARVDRDLATILEGESLFNDGIAVVLYILLLEVLGGGGVSVVQGLGDFLLVVGGGAVVGLGLGILAGRLIGRLKDHLVEVMVTLILVYGAYLLAEGLHLSGVIAVAVAGLSVGNYGLDRTTRESQRSIALFWEIVAFLINSAVFLLIGFELRPDRLVTDMGVIVLVFGVLLASRALIVYGLGALVNQVQGNLPWKWRHLIWWGGLRGAVPVALALGLPADLPGRANLVAIIFGVVLISLLGQGLTLPGCIQRLGLSQEVAASGEKIIPATPPVD
jgi:CPA1 family monovalent cation:H+ antiporter